MNVARHLLIVLLVPDKRGIRNVAAAVGLAVPLMFGVPFNSSLPFAALVLVIGLAYYLRTIGWQRVRHDLRTPVQTLREIFWTAPSPLSAASLARRPRAEID